MLSEAALIDALGGPGALGLKLGLKRSAAGNWPKRGIPAQHQLAVWRMALDANLDWEPPGADDLRRKLAQSPPRLDCAA